VGRRAFYKIKIRKEGKKNELGVRLPVESLQRVIKEKKGSEGPVQSPFLGKDILRAPAKKGEGKGGGKKLLM